MSSTQTDCWWLDRSQHSSGTCETGPHLPKESFPYLWQKGHRAPAIINLWLHIRSTCQTPGSRRIPSASYTFQGPPRHPAFLTCPGRLLPRSQFAGLLTLPLSHCGVCYLSLRMSFCHRQPLSRPVCWPCSVSISLYLSAVDPS